MASSNGNRELILTQDKLEWVTPKILEMSAALTDGKAYGLTREVCDGDAHKGSSIRGMARPIQEGGPLDFF